MTPMEMKYRAALVKLVGAETEDELGAMVQHLHQFNVSKERTALLEAIELLYTPATAPDDARAVRESKLAEYELRLMHEQAAAGDMKAFISVNIDAKGAPTVTVVLPDNLDSNKLHELRDMVWSAANMLRMLMDR